MKKVALYCRVSTEMQGDAKTVERQLYELKEYCKRQGYEIAKEYKDVISGTIMKRTELDQLKEDAKNRMFELVLVSEVSRISRGQDAIVDIILFEKEMEKSGVGVYFLDGSSDNEIVKSVKAIIAKTERADFIKRSTNGRLARANRGSVLGTRTKYGYRYISQMKNGFRGGVWEIEPEEAKTVNLILDLYIQLQSQRKVLKELIKRGVKPRGIWGAKNWRGSSFRHIIENDTCATGITYYKGVPITVPAFVSKEKWATVQAIRKERSNKHLRLKASKYLLGGLVWCNACGATYSGEMCKGVRYYRCNNRHRTFPNPKTCNAKMIAADNLEQRVWGAVSYLMEHPDVLRERIDYLNRDNNGVEEMLNQERKETLKKLGVITAKKNKLLDLFTEEAINKEHLLSKVAELDDEEKNEKEKLPAIENKLAQISKKPIFIKNLQEFCQVARIQMKLLSFEEKQEFVRMIIGKVRFDYFKNEIAIDGEIAITEENKPVELRLSTNQRELVGVENPTSINQVFYPNFKLQFNLQVSL